MEGFRAGQHECFTTVFNLLYAPLCHASVRMTLDQDASEDIVEDSFIKVWERREIFFEINVLKSYLYTTVRNASINWIRRNKNVFPLPENIDQRILVQEQESFKYIIESEVYSKLSRAFEQLSPQGRQIMRMIFFEGKKTRGIAEELGISQSTVKTQKGRSLLKLKISLSRDIT